MAAGMEIIPSEGGSARKLVKHSQESSTSLSNKDKVLYIGRIPHGFYEDEMLGKSKHFGFVEFEHPEVAKIVADSMHNYLMFERILQVHLIPPERVHPKLWRGLNLRLKLVDFSRIEMIKHDKDRTREEHQKLLKKILNHDRK